MDCLTKQQRGFLMSKIRGKDTKPEMAIRRLIWGHGFRYRLHDKSLPGRPDLVFPGKHKIVFVHGCFWHGHTCRKNKLPKTNTDFWSEKISRNRSRDRSTIKKLQRRGWKVMVIWECQVNDPIVGRRLLKFLK